MFHLIESFMSQQNNPLMSLENVKSHNMTKKGIIFDENARPISFIDFIYRQKESLWSLHGNIN